MKPFNVVIDLATGDLAPGRKIIRKMSDVKNMFFDTEAAERLIEKGNPLVYEVIYADVPEEIGQLGHCTTIIHPGKVGREYFLTKGHFHENLGTAEIYFCLAGQGKLIMESTDGEWEILDMFPGSSSYIPPYWSHRTMNTGKGPLVFFCIFPGDAGHDYATIEEKGYPKLVVEENGRTTVVDNPKRKA
ncbi:MAG TPA: glucose-6-phosphate isomerase family protein [Atribacteraceae bacterium]|nr:glucose-6-phosphate isomerase family protein [Atribacteraceae bacterium]